MLRSLNLKIIVSLTTFFSNRVPAPEGVILSFARPRQLLLRRLKRLLLVLYLLHPCSRKESIQRQICREQIWTPSAHEVRAPGWRESAGRPNTAYFLRAAAVIGGGQMGLLPHCQRTASMPCPYGLFPMTTSVLGAVYGSFGYAARNITNSVIPIS